jgi:riboflavin synthase
MFQSHRGASSGRYISVFTGLVEDTAVVVTAHPQNGGIAFVLRPTTLNVAGFAVGESISHDGACLTVTQCAAPTYGVFAGQETLAKTTLGSWRAGRVCHLERALRVGDRLGGHWVTGHVDGLAHVVAQRDLVGNLQLELECDATLARYLVDKGSVTLAGVSLTINWVRDVRFGVALIPATRVATTLGKIRPGEVLNLEVDALAKHLDRLIRPYASSAAFVPSQPPMSPASTRGNLP